MDGKVFRDHCMVIAAGIDAQGRKHVLAWCSSPTTSAGAASSRRGGLRRELADDPTSPRPANQTRPTATDHDAALAGVEAV